MTPEWTQLPDNHDDAGPADAGPAGVPHVDRAVVDRTISHLGHRLSDGAAGDGIVTTLERICEGLVGVFGVSGSGLLILDDEAVPRYVVASDATARALEVAQEQLGQGPCVDALIDDVVVVVEDFTTDERWPDLAALVVPEGIVSMVGIPVELAGGAVGSLNVFRDRPWSWDPSELQALAAFNGLVEHALTIAMVAERNETLVQQLQHALDGRVVIERAVGLVMGRLGADAVTAFNELRSTARARRIPVRELATELLAELAGS